MNYDPKTIEPKWQKYWEDKQTYKSVDGAGGRKSYLLVEFPYPSGEGLHVGHPRSYTAMDVLARKRRLDGENVLFPMGFDSFGLPTENFAIKTGRPPAEITAENIANFRRQLKSLGFSFDWSREVITSDPRYYKWTQWIFLQLFKKGLAYKAKSTINWCPSCRIGLANEEVVNGKCERCGTAVETREKEQWMLKITSYADKLLAGLDNLDWIPQVVSMQTNWIGRSEGYTISFPLNNVPGQENGKHSVEVFTTRPDTLYGGTFIVLSPEKAKAWLDVGWQAPENVQRFVAQSLTKSERVRLEEADSVAGVDTGITAVNPATGAEMSVWIAEFVLGGYGTGAVFADAHDERDFIFAQHHNIPLKPTLKPADGKDESAIRNLDVCFSGYGILYDSAEFDGLTSEEAIPKIGQKFGQLTTQYKLRDWVFSRQRYWGEPIPMVHCANCAATGAAPDGWVPLPESTLPLELPAIEKYQPSETGESPLAQLTDWVNTTCPNCASPASRETDTMPNWAGSSWYYLRYCDPQNDQVFASAEKLKYWLPVDWYNGGMEHTTLHLLYSRFWHLFLHDIGLVPTPEPYTKRTSHGMILAEDGKKMSKSLGNVVNPDEVVATCGADTLRVYEMFMGPFADSIPWSTDSIAGVRRFLERVWHITLAPTTAEAIDETPEAERELARQVAKVVRKVGEDIESFHFNTSVSSMMEFTNFLFDTRTVKHARKEEALQIFLTILYPFAPHLAAELWSIKFPNAGQVWEQSWPTYNEADLTTDTINVAVQVNGKLRGTIIVTSGATEEEIVTAARQESNVAKWLSDKPITKTIVKNGKLVNFVIAE